MDKMLNCILLIDDDEPTNFLNRRMLEEMQCAKNIQVIQKAQEALEYLKNIAEKDDGSVPFPDLIFLDINMPAMDGWEFLVAFKALITRQKMFIPLVMLTTSLNPEDEQKANESPEVIDFKSKPLTCEMVRDVLSRL
jgi:CheY-like chemotaxis protein